MPLTPACSPSRLPGTKAPAPTADPAPAPTAKAPPKPRGFPKGKCPAGYDATVWKHLNAGARRAVLETYMDNPERTVGAEVVETHIRKSQELKGQFDDLKEVFNKMARGLKRKASDEEGLEEKG